MKASTNAEIYRRPGSLKQAGPAILRDKEKKIVFLSGTRTPFGRVGGSLKDLSPIDLGAIAARAAIGQAGLDDRAELIDAAIFGNGMPAT